MCCPMEATPRRAPRIPYYPSPWGDLDASCADCGVAPEAWHRPRCPSERCPACGGRLIDFGRATSARQPLVRDV